MTEQLPAAVHAFRSFVRSLRPTPGLAAAAALTGINQRTLQRIYHGTQPLRPRLAGELAALCTDPATAAQLRAIAEEQVHV